MEDKRTSSVLMDKYELGKQIGQGTFARVYRARNLETKQNVAIKILDKEKILKVGMMEQIKREISVMRLIKHPNVVRLYEVMATKSKIYMVMEYVKGGELFNKVAKGRLKEDVARKYFQQLVNVVDYCHSRGIYHRDIKPENLLVDENGNLKVSDFGLSALVDSKRQDGMLHTTCGTPAYVAPEVISRKGYDGAKADIWSCGVVLYVLLAGFLPFQDANLMEMYRKIGKAEFRFPSWFPHEAKRLVLKILDPNPKKRIEISKIMENPWFKKGYNRKQFQEQESKKETRRYSMNAFDIISFSEGCDLSGLFQEKSQKKEVRFTTKHKASTIISRLEDVAERLKIKVKKKEDGVMKFEGIEEGRKGVLCFDAEIFEVTSSLHIVEMNKCSGDTLEYHKVIREDLRPALKDIVWTWQGEQIEPTSSSSSDIEVYKFSGCIL